MHIQDCMYAHIYVCMYVCMYTPTAIYRIIIYVVDLSDNIIHVIYRRLSISPPSFTLQRVHVQVHATNPPHLDQRCVTFSQFPY